MSRLLMMMTKMMMKEIYAWLSSSSLPSPWLLQLDQALSLAAVVALTGP